MENKFIIFLFYPVWSAGMVPNINLMNPNAISFDSISNYVLMKLNTLNLLI